MKRLERQHSFSSSSKLGFNQSKSSVILIRYSFPGVKNGKLFLLKLQLLHRNLVEAEKSPSKTELKVKNNKLAEALGCKSNTRLLCSGPYFRPFPSSLERSQGRPLCTVIPGWVDGFGRIGNGVTNLVCGEHS